MKMSGGPSSINIKIPLLIVALIIAGGTLIYTQKLVQKLQEKERQIVQFYANGIEYVANSSPNEDITFLFENILKPIDFPLINSGPDDKIKITDKYDITDVRNIPYDTSLSISQLEKFFNNKIREMDKIHRPIAITYRDSVVLQRIHYGDSKLVNQLKFYPFLQIIIAALFILLAYVGFSSIKKSEQSNIWVGMAKETAHQFGTPLSSLLGWIEMLRLNYADKDKVIDITEEINNDVERLNKITYRFSKIGAAPELKQEFILNEIKKVVAYFQRRLPQIGKGVELTFEGDDTIYAEINSELFEWVIENLIKNALDAIEHKNGKIKIEIKQNKKFVIIEVTDNGKGIDLNRRKDIFRPGYSTKRRGWGLGLSLSKRIIESYHHGKIYVKTSTIGEGTTFRIELKKS
jgi:signal transduction histidine kinase